MLDWQVLLTQETERWREALLGTIVSVESELGVDNEFDDYDECADEFCRLTLQFLADEGADYKRLDQHRQRRAFVIVEGSDYWRANLCAAEIDALDDAMQKATDHVRDYVVRTAKSLSAND